MTDNHTPKSPSFLIGIGLDAGDGHVRITRGPGFGILGGSQQTHQMMQDTALKIHETLQQRRQTIADLDANAIVSLLQEIDGGMVANLDPGAIATLLHEIDEHPPAPRRPQLP